MDFGRPLQAQASTASQSNIRYLEPVTAETATGETLEERARNVTLDNQVIQAANETAAATFLGRDPQQEIAHDDDNNNAWLLDASQYTDRMTPAAAASNNDNTIQAGDLVVIQESFDRLDFVYCKAGDIYNNRNGHFHHNDFIGKKPFGSKLRSRNLQGYGYIYLLKPTPELWTRSLNHRTQVVHECDQSQIIWQLWIRPDDVVVESGTGSGAMSHALLRSIAPAGHLHTYEFSRHRCDVARREFRQHGLGHLVTVHHKDVCHGIVAVEEGDEEEEDGDDDKNDHTPGFDLPDESVDAVFLDLPEPWVAVPHAAKILRPDARIATYSPCVEQTQRTIEAMEANGFHSIKTMEYRLKEYYVDEVESEPLPTVKRQCREPHDVNNYATATKRTTNGDKDEDETMELKGDDDEQIKTQERTESAAVEQSASGNKRKHAAIEGSAASGNKRKNLVTRPFGTMRGHTAFLTFATKNPMPFVPTTASTTA